MLHSSITENLACSASKLVEENSYLLRDHERLHMEFRNRYALPRYKDEGITRFAFENGHIRRPRTATRNGNARERGNKARGRVRVNKFSECE